MSITSHQGLIHPVLSEVSIAGIYLPPFFVYACVAGLVFVVLRHLLARLGVLRHAWHPALFEFALSVILLSLLILHV